MTILALLSPTGFVSSWGYAAIFVLSVLQSCCVPTSSELTFGFGGVLAAQGTLKLPGVIAAGAAGEVVGAYIAWGVGRAGGRPMVERFGRYVLLSPVDLDRAEGWYGRHDRWGVLASRLLPLIRNFVAVPAGAARVRPVRFGILTAIGSLIWATVMTLIGYAIGNRWQTIMKGFSAAGYVLGAVGLLALVVVVWHRWRSYRTATRRGGSHFALHGRPTAGGTFVDDVDSTGGANAPAWQHRHAAVRTPDQAGSIEPGGVFPFSDYESLSESMILSALSSLTPKQLLQVRQYESANARRGAILARIDPLLAIRTTVVTATSTASPPANGAARVPRPARAPITPPKPVVSASLPGSTGQLVDRAFGGGTFGRLSQATLDDVVDCLRRDRVIDAAFSAGHHLAFGHEPGWTRAEHQRMVEARLASIERDRRERRVMLAASGCAALRLLTADLPDHVEVYASGVRSDLRWRLAQQQIDVRTAGAAADLFLISGEWLPDEEQSSALIRAVSTDIAARLQVAGDPLTESARVAMWIVASKGARTRPTHGWSRGDNSFLSRSTGADN